MRTDALAEYRARREAQRTELRRLRAVFTSGYQPYCGPTQEDLLTFSRLIRRGVVSERVELLDVPAVPEPGSPDYEKFRWACTGNASLGHGILKWVADRWLRSLGESRTYYEYSNPRHLHGRADVYGRDLGIRVECGSSDLPLRHLAAFGGWFVVVPFMETEHCQAHVFSLLDRSALLETQCGHFDRVRERSTQTP